MPIDLSQVDWLYVALLAIFVFVTAYVGGFLAFGRRWTAALASTVLFVALFVFWTYYPHRVPGPRAINLPGTTTTTAVPAPLRQRRKSRATRSPTSPRATRSLTLHPRRHRLLRPRFLQLRRPRPLLRPPPRRVRLASNRPNDVFSGC